MRGTGKRVKAFIIDCFAAINPFAFPMKVFRGIPNAEARTPCALTIGNFDGVHRGHQALLARVREAAARLGVSSAVMTFEPHPREYFAQLTGDPSKAPTRIANLRDKLQSLSDAGMDRVIVEHFNAGFAALSPQDFVEKVLVQGLHVKWLIVGEDFRYGAKRAGDIGTLIEAGKQNGFQVESLPTVTNDGIRVSSSAVRSALAQGDLALAKQLLGHTYAISGHVIHGQKLGRSLGFPTMNLGIAHRRPALSGIFVVQVHGLADCPLRGVASLGVRPTVDDSGRVLLETHVFGYEEQCYGKLIRVEFLKKLRDEKKYADLPALKDAIADDARQARRYFEQQSDTAISATDRI
jgi:riboflavin kinase/FMN adenylyltransferase